MNRLIFGVDPGLKGSIAVMVMDPNGIVIKADFYDLKNGYVDAIPFMYNWVKKYPNKPIITLEQVRGIHGTSRKATFGFGYSFGSIELVLKIIGIPYNTVLPQTWQKKYRLKIPVGTPKSKRTEVMKRLVYKHICKMYPRLKSQFLGPRGGLLDGRSDAFLIGLYNAHKQKEINKMTDKIDLNEISEKLDLIISMLQGNDNATKDEFREKLLLIADELKSQGKLNYRKTLSTEKLLERVNAVRKEEGMEPIVKDSDLSEESVDDTNDDTEIDSSNVVEDKLIKKLKKKVDKKKNKKKDKKKKNKKISIETEGVTPDLKDKKKKKKKK